MYLLPGEKAEQIDTDGMYQQLDLFSLFSEQVGSLAVEQAERGNEAFSVQPKEPMPKEQVDAILRSGGGLENSRKRIYAKYQQGKNPEEMSAFLKKEYGTTGKGFEFDGRQVSVWFDENGMRAGYGTSATERPVLTMGWDGIEENIRSQVEAGTYMGANEAYLVDEVERSRIATIPSQSSSGLSIRRPTSGRSARIPATACSVPLKNWTRRGILRARRICSRNGRSRKRRS